jgi:ParB family chromosome partitioning protein
MGVAISPRRARAVIAAFRALPRDLTADMDQYQVTVSARLDTARLAGCADAAAEIWAAVKERGRPDLLVAAATARAADRGLNAHAAAGRAVALDAAAAAARAARRTAVPAGQLIDPAVTEALIAALRSYGTLLRAGGYPGEYETGSLRLLALEVAGQLEAPAGSVALREAG